ncbi:MAG: glycosyltransferase family 39 protein [Sedimentisphaerales bacterium]|nr:glycosyltransferase family 39 protein [Sedimentisphaerales bacterium]
MTGIILLTVVIIGKAPTLHLPYHWDEMGVYVGPSHWLAQDSLVRVFPGMHPRGQFFGHPPALYLTLAATYKIFGESIIISHLYILAFSFLGVYFSYLLGAFLFDHTTGLIAALLLFFTPLYFAQSGMVLSEIPITAFGVMSIYYALRNRFLPYLLCGIFLVLLKVTAIALIASILIYIFITEKKGRATMIKILKFSLPLFVLGGFFIWQKIITGSFIDNPCFKSNPAWTLSLTKNLSKAGWVIGWVFLHQYRILLTFLIFLHFINNQKNVWHKSYTLFLIIFLLFLGAFSFIWFGQRYILAFFPYFCITATFAIVALIPRLKTQWLVAAFIFVAFCSQLYNHDKGYGNFDSDMQYTDIIAINQKVCTYIEDNYSDSNILAIWPISSQLRHPCCGYVRQPLSVVSPDKNFDLIVCAPYVDSKNKKLKELIVQHDFMLHKRFEKNGKVIEMYLPR